MTEYIYFVKCTGCDDESFMFFDEAKDFATSCLSRKPVITQTEVCRNDFGECTNHCDLGTIWTWEEAIGDVTCDEPTTEIFASKDLVDYDPDNDPEFTTLDNSCDHFDSLDSIPNNSRKSSHGELTEESVNKFIIVGEKEDRSTQFYNIETKEWLAKSEDATLFDDRNAAIEILHDLDKSDFYTTRVMIKPMQVNECSSGKPIPEGMTIEQLVEEMEENEDTVECVCCQELHPKEDCKYDEKHGWICPDCIDEVVECTWCKELYDRSECRYEVDLGWLCDGCEAAIKSRGETLTFREELVGDGYFSSVGDVEFYYSDLNVTLQGKKRDVDDWDEADLTVSFMYTKDAEDVAEDIWDFYITEEDAADVPGGLKQLEDDTEWKKFLDMHWDTLLDKYYDRLLKRYRSEAKERYEETHSLDDRDDDYFEQYRPQENVKESSTKKDFEQLTNMDDVNKQTSTCPECGTNSFHPDICFCINCGFDSLK